MKKHLFVLMVALLLFSCKREPASAPGTLPNRYSDQDIGKSASDMLTSSVYTSLSIQVQYMPGYALDSVAVANVTAYLASRCNKPGGVSITQSQIAGTGDTMNLQQIAVLEAASRTAYSSGSNLALYILVTNGYDTAATVLGFAYRNTSICLFGQNIFDHSGASGEVTRTALESGVLEHELGHLMGLVNLGTPMLAPHQDVANGYHCTNPKCLMYWEIETHSGFRSMLNTIPVLDSSCLSDLQANGGK